ncbi:MAG: TRCF domain-containing protein, partial [Fulvivirga sp.]|uniref:TRCF domain-containing protein n=1 Tax=Fulvivirga sp. TaxID=1931237 RepID=UPI0032ED15C9
SGFISDLGFDMYHKILDEAVQELKETEFKDLFAKELTESHKHLVKDCNIETDLELIIPEDYVGNISERLSLYNTLDNLKKEEELHDFTNSLIDRFGKLPSTVHDLIETVKLRWQAEELGFEKLTIKNGKLKGYFMSSDREAYFKSEVFGGILAYVQTHPKRCRLKEYNEKLILTVDEVQSIDEAKSTLQTILDGSVVKV